MTTTTEIALRDRDEYPNDAVLSSVFGDAFSAYCDLLMMLKVNNLTPEWRYYSDGKAWLCKVQKEKRTIFWMSAWKGHMKATIYVPQKHFSGISQLDIKPQTLQAIEATKPVGKSQPCTFEISDSIMLADFEKVMLFKVAHK
jgi:hypothetical protein